MNANLLTESESLKRWHYSLKKTFTFGYSTRPQSSNSFWAQWWAQQPARDSARKGERILNGQPAYLAPWLNDLEIELMFLDPLPAKGASCATVTKTVWLSNIPTRSRAVGLFHCKEFQSCAWVHSHVLHLILSLRHSHSLSSLHSLSLPSFKLSRTAFHQIFCGSIYRSFLRKKNCDWIDFVESLSWPWITRLQLNWSFFLVRFWTILSLKRFHHEDMVGRITQWWDW
jgi:hypothetical protein